MKYFTQPIFAFLLSISLFFIGGNGEVRGQWELLLGEEGENWSIIGTDDTPNEDIVFILNAGEQQFLARVNVFGQIVLQRYLVDIGLPNEMTHTSIQVLSDGGYLLFYRTTEGNFLAKLERYGNLVWLQTIEFLEKMIETESGNLLQIASVEIQTTSEEEHNRDVVLTAFNGENGEVMWQKIYGSEADEEIEERKLLEDGKVVIGGRSNRFNAFLMEFSAEGDSIGGYTYDFEGEGVEFHWWAEEEGFYSLEDIKITEENGLIASMVTVVIDSVTYDDYWYWFEEAHPIVEKINNEGSRDWRILYEEDDPAFGYHEAVLNFLSNYHITLLLNGNYLIRATYGQEWYRHPAVMEIASTGELLSFHADYNLNHSVSITSADWACGVGAVVSNIQEVQGGNRWVVGNSFHNFSSINSVEFSQWGFGFGNDLDMGSIGFCNYPYFLARMNDSGGLTWKKFYDLGNADEYYHFAPSLIFPQNHGCYSISTVVNTSRNESLAYIIHTDNEGNSNSNLISGQIFLDANENCQYDDTERSLYEGIVVSIESPLFNYQTFTDSNGNFSVEVPIGEYTVSYSIDSDLVEPSCNTHSYQISFTENYDTLSNLNFPLQALIECPKLEVEIGTPLLRRCFTNTYKIQYCNKGTLPAENAKISLEFPEEMIPLTSSIPALEEEQQWTFDLGTVDIGDCGFFTVTDSISCEAELGSTICLKSRILPDDLCEPPSPLWDGSEVVVSGVCAGEQVVFTLENVGNGHMNEERNFYVYANDVLQESRKIQLASGARQQFYVNPNGKTLRLAVEQSAHFPTSNDESQSIVEACGGSNFSFGYVNSTELFDRHPAVDIDCQEIIGSFDPNDIQVFPSGVGEEHLIEETTRLTYKIRFQNTGNDTAFRVMIVDTLPRELEGATLNLGSSSHDYTFDIKFGNLLVWTFDNILLPDSTTNERESHGFVQYSISPKEGLEVGTKIYNKADIYFDFNAPIATNRVFNTVTDDLEVDLGDPLAVDLVDLDVVVLEGNIIQLDWWTLAEVNSSHFEVERSTNGIDFETIAMVKAQGESEGLWHYQLLDADIGGETVLYYRLKWVDADGTFGYSVTISVRLQRQLAEYKLLSHDGQQLLLDWEGELEGDYTIRIFNLLGQNILNDKVDGLQTILPFLESNVYVIQVVNGEGRSLKSQKVFIRF